MRHSGFSLVELSIVLVILGLLVGGILAGQSLIRASELRTITGHIERYKTATMAFRDKYFALPGDMVNATSFWGDQATGTGACPDAAIANGTPGTCNGDGNNQIAPGTREVLLVWQHLGNAGLVEGSYLGELSGNLMVNGITQPPSISNGSYLLQSSSASDSTAGIMKPGIIMRIAAFQTGTPAAGVYGIGSGPILSPEEAWNLDTKMDDGVAHSGIFKGKNGHSGAAYLSCTTVAGGMATTIPNDYVLTNTGPQCRLFIQME